MSRFLMVWNLEGKKVLMVGGGTVGEGKVEALLDTGAAITVVDATATDRLRDLAAAGRIQWVARRFRPWDVWRATLVVAATGDPATNGRVRRWAHLVRALVNAVDDPPRCDVIMPALVRRGPVTVAISTGGASPAAARFIREEVGRALPADLGDLVEHAAGARRDLRASGAYRYDYQAWRQRFFEPGLEAVRLGNLAALDELRRRFVSGFGQTAPVRRGRVSIVGAGPGGPDLITVRGARALEVADVILYDDLADPALLDLAPVVAERIPVGKRKGSGMPQDEIHRLLVDRAGRGDHVVRLKGGDPFLFGRGAEEVDALAAAGIPVTVVPGLSSALAGPALAGVSVTERGIARSVTVVSGHYRSNEQPDWSAIAAGSDTIVVLMAASTAPGIASRLIADGRDPDEPVAIVHRAGYDDQDHRCTTLAELASGPSPLPAPAIMVVGRVAARAVTDRIPMEPVVSS